MTLTAASIHSTMLAGRSARIEGEPPNEALQAAAQSGPRLNARVVIRPGGTAYDNRRPLDA